MKTLIKLCISTCLASVIPTLSYAELSSYKAEIKATRHGTIDIKADGDITFNMQNNGDWSLRVEMKGGPLKHNEVSEGQTVDGEYRPVWYDKKTKFLFIKEYINWSFDWDNTQVSGKVKKDKHHFELNSIIHDPLSYQLPLRQSLMDGDGTEFNYSFLRYSRPDDLQFTLIGEELLTLKSGRVHTKILRQTKPSRSGEKKLVWVATDYDYIPVRFTTYKDDKIKEDMVVEKLWINGKRVSLTSQ